MTGKNFIGAEQSAQGEYLANLRDDRAGYMDAPYRFAPHNRALNLTPSIRNEAGDYFGRHAIIWHTHASHGLSSQACCLNFLMPLARRPEILGKLIGHALEIDPPKMLVVEKGAFGHPWYVGFEWIGLKNYLSEWPKKGLPTRGANATSMDAVVRFHHEGRDETLFIEWKYTERYGSGLTDHRRDGGESGGNKTRADRYADKAFHPNGPIYDDAGLTLDAFFFEPFYQLLRQQMLAWHTEHDQERDTPGRVRVLHISPRANLDLHKITSRAFDKPDVTDAFDAFKSFIVPHADGVPRFINMHTEDVFGPLLAEMAGDPWSDYITDRYTFLKSASNAVPHQRSSADQKL